MAVSADMIEFSMSLCAAMAARDIAFATGADPTECLGRLLQSQTGSQLYEDDLKLWWDSPRDIAVAFLEEKGMPVPREWQVA